MSVRASIATLALGLALASPAAASDVGYLYGRVETTDGTKYEGQLRWGTEESFWDDIFNATKAENPNVAYVDRDVRDRVRWDNWGNWGNWDFLFGGNKSHLFDHLFAVRFGDLKRLEIERGENLIAELRNGEGIELKGGSNDVGARITVVDPRQGQHSIKWNRIRTVEFLNTPEKLADKLGDPIYGTVKSGKLEFTGRIQWDHDECLTTDELDGDTRDGDVSVEFGEIASIEKYRRGALVKLKSGKELYLTNSNDVNSQNRGVVVVVPKLGSVKIGWEDFDLATFSAPPGSGRAYGEYGEGQAIAGTVSTRRERHEGRLVFDLDETWDCELLHGKNGDTEYMIPFRDIQKISRHGYRRAEIELKIGLRIELEESQDVTSSNDGLLVFAGDRKPTYVAWKDVTEVALK